MDAQAAQRRTQWHMLSLVEEEQNSVTEKLAMSAKP